MSEYFIGTLTNMVPYCYQSYMVIFDLLQKFIKFLILSSILRYLTFNIDSIGVQKHNKLLIVNDYQNYAGGKKFFNILLHLQ